MTNFRELSLAIAESVDAWRIIPRVIIVLYSTLVFNLYMWYRSIPTYIQESCDSGVLRVLIDTGMDLEGAKQIACSVIDIVGGPTAAQSTFVTTIIGLSTGIFGLYVATGRKWDRWTPGYREGRDFSPFDNPRFDDPYDYDDRPPYNPPRRPPYGPPKHRPPYGPSDPHPPRGPWGDAQEDLEEGRK